MTEEMIAKRDELAANLSIDQQTASRMDYYKHGFDAAYKLMEAENAELKSRIEKLRADEEN